MNKSVIHPDACLRHHHWQSEPAPRSEVRICPQCGGAGQVPHVPLLATVAWMAGLTLAIGAVLVGAMWLVLG